MMETLVTTTKVEGKVSAEDAAAAAGELLRMRQSQASASAARDSGSDVGAVVSKAKRAASSLWLLLHAQVRTGTDASLNLSVDVTCVCGA